MIVFIWLSQLGPSCGTSTSSNSDITLYSFTVHVANVLSLTSTTWGLIILVTILDDWQNIGPSGELYVGCDLLSTSAELMVKDIYSSVCCTITELSISHNIHYRVPSPPCHIFSSIILRHLAGHKWKVSSTINIFLGISRGAEMSYKRKPSSLSQSSASDLSDAGKELELLATKKHKKSFAYSR